MGVSRRWVGVLACLGVLAVTLGCAAGPGEPGGSAPATPVWSLSYRLRGGIAGFDVSFSIDSAGRAAYDRRSPDPEQRSGILPAALTSELAVLARDPAFLALPERIEPRSPVADGFSYEVNWAEGGTHKRVIAADGIALPPAFVALREALAAGQRDLLGRATEGPRSTP